MYRGYIHVMFSHSATLIGSNLEPGDMLCLKHCLLYCLYTLNGAVIYIMSNMLYCRGLETSDWVHRLIKNLFTEVVNQMRSIVNFNHKLTCDLNSFWNLRSHPLRAIRKECRIAESLSLCEYLFEEITPILTTNNYSLTNMQFFGANSVNRV